MIYEKINIMMTILLNILQDRYILKYYSSFEYLFYSFIFFLTYIIISPLLLIALITDISIILFEEMKVNK